MGFVGSHLWSIRQKFGSGPLLYPGAMALIFNEQKQLLLGWREEFQEWTAFGGGMELGERITEALAREMNEELGITITSPQFIGVLSGPEYTINYPNGDILQSVMIVFIVHIPSTSQVRVDHDEHSQLEWYDLAKLPVSLHKNTQAALKVFYAYQQTGQVQID